MGTTHVIPLPRFSRQGNLIQPLILRLGSQRRSIEPLIEVRLQLRYLGEVVDGRLVQLDHEDEVGRFLSFLEVDLVRFVAQHVGVAVSDEGPVGEVDTCASSGVSIDAAEGEERRPTEERNARGSDDAKSLSVLAVVLVRLHEHIERRERRHSLLTDGLPSPSQTMDGRRIQSSDDVDERREVVERVAFLGM